MTMKLSASLLSSDMSNLKAEVKKLEDAKVDMLHFDVMDGSFVPNLTFGAPVVKALRKHSYLPFDVHLMINNPENHFAAFKDAGADYLTFHVEAVTHLEKAVKAVKALGMKVGVSLVPSTNEDVLKYILPELDLILVMTVNPGFGGQEFISSQLQKIQNIRKMIDDSGKHIILSVDGGVNDTTIESVSKAGGSMVVSGSYLFNGNMTARVDLLKMGG